MIRGKVHHGDSLELLLDTICNTFGGILFIALLVVIMLQLSSPEIQSTKTEELSTRKLEARLISARQELSELFDLQDGQKQTLNLLAPTDTKRLVHEWRNLKSELQKQKRLQQQLEDELQSKQTRHARLKSEYESTRRAIADAEHNLESLRRDRIAEEKKRVTEIKTPVLRPGRGKSEVAIVIQYDRVYLWHEYDRFGIRRGLNTKDFLALGVKTGFLQTTPNPITGIRLDGTPQSISQLRDLLSPFHPSDNHLAIVVRPDSFDSFHVFREFVSALGFEYNLIPVDSEAPVLDRGGKDTRVQ
ncbi:hypothetical protein [Thalassoglobus polymorphus]|uniref:Uncharacterized protein n=1 Tax=Thalassoglobus polymorphus TaxID=2527994 RepID=A0A517QU89_9PLAN|nr:hypothetical protein [Thalassoglobus polymorphus]QDT35168.1 hypothetical protein Mal48_44440 [Thalassoglobus polymorphus]